MTRPKDNSETERELALLSWIQQLAPYGIVTLDMSLRVQSWNRWMESHSSLSPTTVTGRNILEIFPELKERKLTGHFERALQGESSVLSTALHHHLLSLKSPLGGGEGARMRQTARITARTAFEARSVAATEKIDVLISDIGLPDGNGNDLMKYLKGVQGLKGIALTGYGMEEDIAECLASGFFTHLVKPVNVRSLESALSSVLGS